MESKIRVQRNPTWAKPSPRKNPPFNAFLLQRLRRLPHPTEWLREHGMEGKINIGELYSAKHDCGIRVLNRYLKAFGLKIGVIREEDPTFPEN